MKLVKCAHCGMKRSSRRMIRRRLNGTDYFCCSIACEVRWEKARLFGVCG